MYSWKDMVIKKVTQIINVSNGERDGDYAFKVKKGGWPFLKKQQPVFEPRKI